MNHLSEEQLILHYYGEEGDSLSAERHLEECEACRRLYGGVQRVLNVVDSMPIPELAAEYGAQVWRRIEGQLCRLPVRRRAWWLLPGPWRWAVAGAAFAALMVTAFVAGRFYPQARRSVRPDLQKADRTGHRSTMASVNVASAAWIRSYRS